MDRKAHWENIYTTKHPTNVSWYQPRAAKSLELIRRTGIDSSAQIIDVGGGASTLVDGLLAEGFRNVTVLDVSSAALEAAKQRLGTQDAQAITWLDADITQATLPRHSFDVWHDRAVFHFLAAAEERRNYIAAVTHALKPDGHLIIATFAADGPLRCSGLDVVRYDIMKLRGEFSGFQFIESSSEDHLTPFGTKQHFIYCRFRQVSSERATEKHSCA